MKPLNKKNDFFQSSKIREMTILANKYDAINLAQGFPEFDPPKELLHKLSEIVNDPVHQYGPNWGVTKFREKIAAHYSSIYGRKVSTDEVLITCGSTEAMMAAEFAVLNPGDKVAMFSPYYVSYSKNAFIAGADSVFIPLNPEDLSIDYIKLDQVLSDEKVKALILCNPSNPSGKVFSRDELELIAKFVKKYDLYVITDEVYEYILYEPYEHIGFATLKEMYERTISCHSLSKTYAVTGWRLGYVLGPPELLNEVRKYHDFFTVCAPTPLQVAAIEALSFDDEYYKQVKELYTRKKEIFISGLGKLGYKFINPQGTYYVLVNIEEFGIEDDSEFAIRLVEKYKIAGVPGSEFFADKNNHFIRFHFAKNDDTLIEVLNRLALLKKNGIKK